MRVRLELADIGQIRVYAPASSYALLSHPTTSASTYTPKTNGKAERFAQTLLLELAYARPYASSTARNRALQPFVTRCNRKRPHASLGGRSPAEALQLIR